MPLGLAILGAAGISGIGSVISGFLGSNASSKAANEQAQTAQEAMIIQQQNLNAEIGRLQPFITSGTNATNILQGLTGTEAGGNPLTAPLTAPFAATPGAQLSALEATPGYQFTRQQGLIAAQNAMAGSQPGGAALKSGINYAEGLASTTFQQQFQNYLANNQQIYNILAGQQATGANAAAGLNTNTTAGTNAISNLATGAGAAQAAGTIGSASAITGALGNGTNALTNAIGVSALSGNLFGGQNAISNINVAGQTPVGGDTISYS
jgi:hypothetical protein